MPRCRAAAKRPARHLRHWAADRTTRLHAAGPPSPSASEADDMRHPSTLPRAGNPPSADDIYCHVMTDQRCTVDEYLSHIAYAVRRGLSYRQPATAYEYLTARLR